MLCSYCGSCFVLVLVLVLVLDLRVDGDIAMRRERAGEQIVLAITERLVPLNFRSSTGRVT